MDAAFVTAVEAIYAAAPDPSLWRLALQAVADVFGDIGAVLIWQRDDGSFGTIVSPRLVSAQREFERHWWRFDIRSERALQMGYVRTTDGITDRHLMTEEEIDTHPIYTQFLVPHGMGWFGGTSISPDPWMRAWISVQRSKARHPFTDEELAVVTRLGRHAEKALRLGIRLMDADVARLGFGEALARIGIGVFLLDYEARVMFSNTIAERLCGDGLDLRDGRVIARLPGERADLSAALARVLDLTEDSLEGMRAVLITRSSSPRPLTVYVLPVPRAQDPVPRNFLSGARAIVLAIDPEPGEPPDPAIVRDVLGLTLGEARIAALIGSGLPPREAADRLGITEETARTALKRVFAKVGVSRQSELTALLTRLMLR